MESQLPDSHKSSPLNNLPSMKCNQEISPALQERLKRCGRYHLGTPKSHSQTLSVGESQASNKSESLSCETNFIKKRKLADISCSASLEQKFVSDSLCTPSQLVLQNIEGKTLQNEFTEKSLTQTYNNSNTSQLKELKDNLESVLKEKNEQLRKLKMVKMYREKNNLTDLQALIDKWREVSQKALGDLLDAHPEPKPSMTQLIDHLLIDHDLIQYNADEEGFS
ncbi:swi5-dependent recombination DNA repair protein 1 homolog [Physella acuta]|uniref:swi5-dependent recombination DNA repair protein 1 homolog n=1 Tax=Physella acuta TaxID=109671 RepID=UPI0027DBF840|nr:swi5-dependent recombination DNA repair protein 1 homolog [Physella acuta]XP_059171617.1 swi5-dependent recombination DNA repair protein 1 homolog [Physella acuta]XP_059171618.1 swi5-dependent recombination DNA repair protein 1 homolog [Physella acuta]XP_059171619.1 swi5-dependent recombination DNA repair protein 1 homolog [Physella acuta]